MNLSGAFPCSKALCGSLLLSQQSQALSDLLLPVSLSNLISHQSLLTPCPKHGDSGNYLDTMLSCPWVFAHAVTSALPRSVLDTLRASSGALSFLGAPLSGLSLLRMCLSLPQRLSPGKAELGLLGHLCVPSAGLGQQKSLL